MYEFKHITKKQQQKVMPCCSLQYMKAIFSFLSTITIIACELHYFRPQDKLFKCAYALYFLILIKNGFK